MKHIFSNKFTKIIKPWLKKNYIVFIILFALIAIGISIFIGISQSVWFDEAYSIELAKKSLSQIVSLTAVDVHPPFYYFILHYWGNIFGWGELALRSLSAICLGGSVMITGLLVKKIFGYRASYFVLPFVAFSPLLIRYGFEIRMYALAGLIGISATFVLVLAKMYGNSKKSRILYFIYAVLVALGMFTLYYMALLWLAHFVWLVYQSIKGKEKLLSAKWLWAYGLSVVIFCPWLVVFFGQISNGALAAISQAMTLENLFGIVSFNFLYRPVWQLGAFYSLIVIFVVIMIAYLSIQAYKIIKDDQKKYLSLFFCYILVPIIILTVIGLFKPMYTERYLAHISIGGLIYIGVISAIVTRQSGIITKIFSGLLLVILFVGILQLADVGNYNFQRLQKPEVKAIASIIEDYGDDVTLLAGDPYVATELGYYFDLNKINFYSDYASLGGGYAPLKNSPLRIANPASELAKSGTILYAHYGDSALIMPTNHKLYETQSFGGMTVEKYIAN